MNLAKSADYDVRMRGFRRRTPVADFLHWIDGQVRSLPVESIPLEFAHERVLASEVIAGVDVPSFSRAAMDGFAVRADETTGAGDYAPVSLRVVGEALPGGPWSGVMQAGETVRIMTGAPLPNGADAVVPAEHVRIDHGSVSITTAATPGKHVGAIGEDLKSGSRVFSMGRQLRPQDVGVLASLGYAHIAVVRRPVVRLIVTGNELAIPGEPIRPYQIYEANSFVVQGLVDRDGGVLESLRRLPDDPMHIAAALQAPGADVILVSGGSSVGREDHAPRLIRDLGELAIHGVAMRPSSPAGVGTVGGVPVFLLPGNPVSCLCAYDFFAGRAIRRLGGRSPDWPYRGVEAMLSRKLVSEIGRTDYCRVRLKESGIEPLGISGASMLSSTTRADGFVVVPEASEGYAAGTQVTVWLYDAASPLLDTAPTER